MNIFDIQNFVTALCQSVLPRDSSGKSITSVVYSPGLVDRSSGPDMLLIKFVPEWMIQKHSGSVDSNENS